MICTSLFVALKGYGVVESALYVGIGAFAVAFIALAFLKESFHTDLDFIEAEAQPL